MQVKIVLVLLCVTPIIFSKVRRYSRLQTDPLSKTRCDLVCLDARKEEKVQCRTTCRAQERKPGTCRGTEHPRWSAACVEACNMDSQCDGTQRCCRHGCSSTCSEPADLLTIPGLPALPNFQEIKERRRSVVIRWSDGVGDAARTVPGKVLYILEEQHHLGPKYEEVGLGDWNLLMRTNKTKISLKSHLKPGRWYRFRVAAVSALGTRGYSEPSAPFTPRKGPRPPPAPKKLKVLPLKSNNVGPRKVPIEAQLNQVDGDVILPTWSGEHLPGNVTVRLEWKEPRSDLPIMRYKVFWSRRVKGLGRELDSVLVNHQTVPKEQTYVDIKDLQPNSMYFLQVQTISHFGLGKLRSDKAAIFYNTTGTNIDQPPEPLRKKDRKIRNLKLIKIIWVDHRLKAKISWEPVSKNNDKNKRFSVHWKTIKCQKPQKQSKDLLAITEETTFDIYELDYNCSYLVSVNKTRNDKMDDSDIIITVPDCEYFKRKVNSTVMRCP